MNLEDTIVDALKEDDLFQNPATWNGKKRDAMLAVDDLLSTIRAVEDDLEDAERREEELEDKLDESRAEVEKADARVREGLRACDELEEAGTDPAPLRVIRAALGEETGP